MSYATRLIADSAPTRIASVGATPVAPLEVDIDVITPSARPPIQPATLDDPAASARPTTSARRVPQTALPDDADHARGPMQSDRASTFRQPEADRHRPDLAERSDAERAIVGDAGLMPSPRWIDVGPAPALPSATVWEASSEGPVEPAVAVESDENPQHDAFDRAGDGIPFRRLAGVDLAVPGRPADGRDAAEGEPADPLTARPFRSDDRAVDHTEIVGRQPEVERLSLSIGSIEVIVDPPERMIAPAPIVAAPPAPVSSRAMADPIMRLRRQYVTWPDGD